MGKIIYLGHFGNSKNPRLVFPAAQTMVRYMRRCIVDAGYPLTMVSMAQTDKFCKLTEQILSDGTKLIFTTSFKLYEKNVIMRFFTKFKRAKTHFKELDEIIEDGDTLIAYHSLSTMSIINKLRQKKKFKFILQVCEIYADVTENKKLRKKEIEFINSADKYIFISDLLKEQIELNNKEYAICSGAYATNQPTNEPLNDGKIHVVYAGTLDEKKGGAYSAICAAKYLNEKYHIHILGAADENQKKNIQTLIDNVKNESNCTVTYDGYMAGKKYTDFLQSCHIGLSTQNPEGDYNNTSFPSKILVYLSNGLRVVSVKIPAIEHSPVGNIMYFYEGHSAKDIAEAILSVDFDKENDGRKMVDKLNKELIEKIKELLD
ncbi:MAG: hypothetical protein IKA02_05735 [Clostridia bacterium]|nr:hypothetical protein [Clostridia bacterium]